MMKNLIALLFVSLFHSATPAWFTDMEKAKAEASSHHELILLNFSGSDWCIPCIRLHKEIFESSTFTAYAADHLVLVNADFPRLKKNQLPKDQSARNDAMADQYNAKGTFPLTLLMTPDGKIVKQWQGMPDESPEKFVEEIQSIANAGS